MISKEYSYKVPPRRTMISELRRVIRTSRGFAKHYENGINFVHEVEEMLEKINQTVLFTTISERITYYSTKTKYQPY